MPRPQLVSLENIAAAIEDARKFTENMNREEFLSSPVNDKLRYYAVCLCFTVIRKAIERLPKDLKKRHRNVPWMEFRDIRNQFEHGDIRIPPEIMWDLIEKGDMDDLYQSVKQEISDILKNDEGSDEPEGPQFGL